VADALSPAQAEVLALLRQRHRPRPEVEVTLAAGLRQRMESALAALAAGLATPLFIGKSHLTQVHACEAHHQALRAQPFAWSMATARGSVAHRAIELSLHRRDRAAPLVLVDDALTRLEDDPGTSLADFLTGLDEGARAELRSEVNDLVAKFCELWPPLARQWAPRTESRVRAELCDDRLQLGGTIDLALGAASGMTPGSVLVELKSGASSSVHLDDLRFYALLETLRVGVPPLRVACYYLDSGTFTVEEVDADVLDAALLRTVGGAQRILELALGLRTASATPSRACSWCPLRCACPSVRTAGGDDPER
jgi:hypothetical protein